jgi:hypothetical protein
LLVEQVAGGEVADVFQKEDVMAAAGLRGARDGDGIWH